VHVCIRLTFTEKEIEVDAQQVFTCLLQHYCGLMYSPSHSLFILTVACVVEILQHWIPKFQSLTGKCLCHCHVDSTSQLCHRACMVALLALASPAKQPSQPQASKIECLGTLPGLGAA